LIAARRAITRENRPDIYDDAGVVVDLTGFVRRFIATKRDVKFRRALLWLFVIAAGIELGAGLYEARVIVPGWAGAPPDSVMQWRQLHHDYPQIVADAGTRFWIVSTPLLGLLAIANFIAAFFARGSSRRWWLLSSGLTILVIATTFIYFVPTLTSILAGPANVAAATVHRWTSFNWVRAGVVFIAWLCGLRALTITERESIS
jgi:hypothetical protein